MDLLKWLETGWGYLLIIAAGIGSIMTLSKNIKDIKDKIVQPEKEQDERIKKVEDYIDYLKDGRPEYDALLMHTAELETENKKSFEVINEALTCLIRDRIHGYYFRKCTEKGYITPIELEIVDSLFTSYKNSGGNGMIAREMDILNKLPVKDKQE